MAENAYRKIAGLYDHINDDSAAFLLFVEKHLKKKGKLRVLDLGCGTGKYSIPLAKKGFAVYGVDPSPHMLRVAEKKGRKEGLKIRFCRGTVVSVKLRKGFDVAVSSECINSIQEEELPETFAAVFSLLDKGGKFIFDLKTRSYFDNVAGEAGYGGRVKDSFFVWEDEVKDDEHYITLSLFSGKGGNLYERAEEIYHERTYPVAALRKKLRNAGFRKVMVYGENFGRVKEADEKIYVAAEKVR
jgi:cyclopropane fatty-acyl-phospholipid synthase-like methyltransferase